jgi:hypothetical protein
MLALVFSQNIDDPLEEASDRLMYENFVCCYNAFHQVAIFLNSHPGRNVFGQFFLLELWINVYNK